MYDLCRLAKHSISHHCYLDTTEKVSYGTCAFITPFFFAMLLTVALCRISLEAFPSGEYACKESTHTLSYACCWMQGGEALPLQRYQQPVAAAAPTCMAMPLLLQ